MPLQDSDIFLVTKADASESRHIRADKLFSGIADDWFVVIQEGTVSKRCLVSELADKASDTRYMLVNQGATSYKIKSSTVVDKYVQIDIPELPNVIIPPGSSSANWVVSDAQVIWHRSDGQSGHKIGGYAFDNCSLTRYQLWASHKVGIEKTGRTSNLDFYKRKRSSSCNPNGDTKINYPTPSKVNQVAWVTRASDYNTTNQGYSAFQFKNNKTRFSVEELISLVDTDSGASISYEQDVPFVRVVQNDGDIVLMSGDQYVSFVEQYGTYPYQTRVQSGVDPVVIAIGFGYHNTEFNLYEGPKDQTNTVYKNVSINRDYTFDIPSITPSISDDDVLACISAKTISTGDSWDRIDERKCGPRLTKVSNMGSGYTGKKQEMNAACSLGLRFPSRSGGKLTFQVFNEGRELPSGVHLVIMATLYVAAYV